MSNISDVINVIRSQFSRLKVPTAQDKVYKDECMFSFDSPFSDKGLFVNIATWQGFGDEYLIHDIRRGGKLYLHQKWTQTPKDSLDGDYMLVSAADGAPEPSKLAIGIPGGFITEAQFDLTKEHTVIVIADDGSLVRFPFPNPDLPEFVSNVINAIIDHAGMKSKMQVDSWEADQEKFVSKYAADLQVLSTGKKISQDPSTWKCEESGDTQNLWLNLSTGYIGGGRKNWDGSGGSGAALKHYQDTGRKYPLCVKLGTITPHGADVWSYAEDEDTLVLDPLLPQHLSHWGIDIMKLEKTDKTLSEMEVDMNMKYDWSRLMDEGEAMTTLSGPGFVGLRNIGSSCYLNSVMQTLLHVPEVQLRYLAGRSNIIASAPADPSTDIPTQFSKLADGVLTGKYCPPLISESAAASIVPTGEAETDSSTLEKYVVAPRMFKQIVAKGHSEFSSGRQQDVSEYFQHFLDVLTTSEKNSVARLLGGDGNSASEFRPTSSLFTFLYEMKYKCLETGQVTYNVDKVNTYYTMDLPIPLHRAVNKDIVDQLQERKKQRLSTESSNAAAATKEDEDVKLVVPFDACMERFFGEETVEKFNPSLGRNVAMLKSVRLKTFPKYLMVKMGRYAMGANWVQMKIDASVTLPEKLDLSNFRGLGLQEGEVAMPSDSATTATATATAAAPATPEIDEAIVAQLMSMGFSEWGSKRAAMAHKNADDAMSWIFEHMEDTDFNEPFVIGASGPSASAADAFDSEKVDMLVSMGYSTEQSKAALKTSGGDLEAAMEWIFSHMDDLEQAVNAVLASSSSSTSNASSAPTSATEVEMDDGNGKYSLCAIISHIGRSTESGHYICHIKNEQTGEWALFNDEKVAVAKKPPFQYGFMYMYKREYSN